MALVLRAIAETAAGLEVTQKQKADDAGDDDQEEAGANGQG